MMRSPSQRDRPVGRLGGTLADHDHVLDRAADALGGVTVRPAVCPAGAKSPCQFTAQFPAALDVEGLVDRLVGHVHLRPVRKAGAQDPADLLRAPPQGQVVLYEVPQLKVLPDLSGLGPGASPFSPAVGVERLVGEAAIGHGPPVAPDLPADGGRTASQLARDAPDRRLPPQPVGDVNPLRLGQEPGRSRAVSGLRRHGSRPRPIDGRDRLLAVRR